MQYQSFSPDTQVLGRATAALLESFPIKSAQFQGLLRKHRLENISPTQWYPVQTALNFLRDVEVVFGPNTLFAIGKTIADSAYFPEDVNDIPAAIATLDVGYQMNHRNGIIGYYKLIYFDPSTSNAVLESCTPYPSEFDRGFFTNCLRKFRRPGNIILVEADLTKESRLTGGDRCFYNISW